MEHNKRIMYVHFGGVHITSARARAFEVGKEMRPSGSREIQQHGLPAAAAELCWLRWCVGGVGVNDRLGMCACVSV